MGRVMEIIKLTNEIDVAAAQEGRLQPEKVRSVEVEALVDTGATMLVLPADVVAALGIRPAGTRKVRYANGTVAEIPWVGNVRIEILGRMTICTALVEAAGST